MNYVTINILLKIKIFEKNPRSGTIYILFYKFRNK